MGATFWSTITIRQRMSWVSAPSTQCPVALTTLPSKVVDAEDLEIGLNRERTLPNDAEQRVPC
jgi:hypothetical protein